MSSNKISDEKYQKLLDISNEIDKLCKTVLEKCDIENAQKEFLNYSTDSIVRIIDGTNDKKCDKCVKKAVYFNTETKGTLCWKHAHECYNKK